MRGRWITPANEAPSANACRRFLIPADPDWLAIFMGALDDLRFAVNYEQIGGVTPEVVASTFAAVFDLGNTEDFCMIGVVIPYATSTPPPFTLDCDGATYLRVDYPALYAALDATFLLDADHFQVPDLRGRTVLGIGTGSGLSARSMGDSAGVERVTLDTSEIPSHAHTDGIAVPTVINGGLEAPASSAFPGSGITGSAGGGASHDNMMPFFALGYAIIAR